MPVSPKTHTTLLTIIGSIMGLLVGSSTMWFTFKDRIEQEVEERVTNRLKTETKLSRLDERVKNLESQIWKIKTQPKN